MKLELPLIFRVPKSREADSLHSMLRLRQSHDVCSHEIIECFNSNLLFGQTPKTTETRSNQNHVKCEAR